MTLPINLGERSILRVVARRGKITHSVRKRRWTITQHGDVLTDHVSHDVAPRFPGHYVEALESAGLIRRRRIFWEITDLGKEIALA